MKKLVMVVSMLVLGFSGLYATWDNATEIQKGRKIAPAQINVTSTTAVLIVASPTTDIYSCDLSIVNNTDYILWISSDNTVDYLSGFPILPRKHYSFDGINVGNIWAKFDTTMSGTAKVYINKFLNR